MGDVGGPGSDDRRHRLAFAPCIPDADRGTTGAVGRLLAISPDADSFLGATGKDFSAS